MTLRGQVLSPHPLPIAIVDARVVEIATTSGARLLAISSLATPLAAHPLGAARRTRGLEHLAALGTAAAGGHALSVARVRDTRSPGRQPRGSVSRRPARAIRRRPGSRSRREVDQREGAAEAFSGTRPPVGPFRHPDGPPLRALVRAHDSPADGRMIHMCRRPMSQALESCRRLADASAVVWE